MNLVTDSTALPRNPTVLERPQPVADIPGSDVAQQGFCVERLKELLDLAAQLLASGDAERLPDICKQITLEVQGLATSNTFRPDLQLNRNVADRAKMLLEMNRQLCFCRAMLRRWKRSLVLRQQLLVMRNQAEYYIPHIASGLEIP